MKLKRFYGVYFTLGCLFLVEPTVQLFDVLPNAIGFLLIATALKEISVLEYRIEAAMKLLYYGAGVSAVRFALMFFTFDMDSSAVLSAVTLLGVAEILVLISFFVSFFGGLSYLAQRCESENVLGKIDSIRTLGIVFAVIHTGMTILPELTALIEISLSHDPDAYPNLTLGRLNLYKNYATVLAFVISLIGGIWWASGTLSFMKGVRGDAAFRTAVEKRYGDYIGETPDEEFYLSLKSALLLMTVGYIFCMNLRIYDDVGLHYNLVVPAWVGTLLLALALRRLGGGLYGVLGFLGGAAVQLVFGHFLTEGVGESVGAVLIPVTIFALSFTVEELLKKCLLEKMGLDIGPDLLKQRLALAIHLGLSIAYGLTGISLLHSFKVVFFVLWIIFARWTFSAVGDEIKYNRKTN